jgi:hypothetical protein
LVTSFSDAETYLVISVLIAPSHLFEHIYIESILHYDSANFISLNWIALLGIIMGSFFAYQTFALRKWRYRTMSVIGISAIIAHLILFYFLVYYDLPKEALILPILLRVFGYVVVAISFLTSLTRVPFQNFPQALSIQNFAGASFGSAFGAAVLGQALHSVVAKNTILLSSNLDHLNTAIQQTPHAELYGLLKREVLLVSMKEIYGWLILLGIFCLLFILLRESTIRPKAVIHPTYRAIRRLITKGRNIN